MTEEIKSVEEFKTTVAPTPESVIAKVQKNEKLSDAETEIFKALPKENLPSPAIGEKPAETSTAASEPKPGEEKKEVSAADPEKISEDRRNLIHAELDKPDSEVDLSKFKSPVEIGLYWDLKKARNKNQKLQDEIDVHKVTKIVEDLKKKEEPAVEEEDPLKDRDDDDVLTVADVRKLMAKKPAAKEEKVPAGPPIRTNDQIRVDVVEARSNLKEKGITDFDDVADFAGYALAEDKDAQEILIDAAKKGQNTAEKTYWLIKGSKKWPEIEKTINKAKAKPGEKPAPKIDENLRRAEKIQENETKVRVSGGGQGAEDNSGEYTLAEIKSMTHKDIKALPRKTRQAILEKYGSSPNFNV